MMDMKTTTLGQTEAKALSAQLRSEIIGVLAEATEPLAMREIMDMCDSALNRDQVTAQLGNLKKSGDIVQAGTREPTEMKRGAKPVPIYALAPMPEMALSTEEAERLAEYIGADLERKTEEMGEQASLSDTIDAVTQTAWSHVSHGSESHDGDEFERSTADTMIETIRSLNLFRTISDSEKHATRLCALADALADVPGILPVTDWLYQLADEIDP